MCSSMKAVRRFWRSLTFSENSNCMLLFRQPGGHPGQRLRAGAEILEPGILGLAAMIPAVDLLDDDRQFEDAQHLVVTHVGHIPPGARGIPFDQLIARVPAGPRG